MQLVFGDQHGDHALAFFEHHAAHTTRVAPHRTHVVFIKAHRLAAVGEQHHIVGSVGEGCANQKVALVQVNGNDAGLAWVGKFVQAGFLDRAHARGHEDVLVSGEAALLAGQRQHDGDFFAVDQREHIDDGSPARAA